ncbi:MAG: fatty acid desaturase [Sumerlaeia bacterium]
MSLLMDPPPSQGEVIEKHEQVEAQLSAKEYNVMTAEWSNPNTLRSTRQLVGTLVMFFALWVGAYFAMSVSYALSFVFIIPAACFVVRLFMIQHDCGHGSYFKSRKLQDWLGFCIGVITLTPYQLWRRCHAHHHSHSGDLAYGEFGEIKTMTVNEYNKLSSFRKFKYRLYRNPLTLFGLGPIWQFVIIQRFAIGIPENWVPERWSVVKTNFAMAAVIVVMSMIVGIDVFLAIQVPITIIASGLGVWLFYVQHQFDEGYYRQHVEWNYVDGALLGSSHLVLPKFLQWLTANIGLHHIHHLNARIPNYKLEDCMNNCPRLQNATKIKMIDTWNVIFLTLWDEDRRRLIRFSELNTK